MANKKGIKKITMRKILLVILIVGLSVLAPFILLNVHTDTPPPEFKVAFIGDQGLTDDSKEVLRLIKDEGAEMVLHQGDFDYANSPDLWDQQINDILGPNFPYFASIGNQDRAMWPGYQQKLIERLNRIPEAMCTGDLGVKSACRYRGLFFVLSGVGTLGEGHEIYIRDQLAQDNSAWRICSWHKNQRLMQVGKNGNSTGWGAYEECRLGGAIITTAHNHSYARTHLMENFSSSPRIASTSNTLQLEEGKSFVFVSGLGGDSIDDQLRNDPWWASIYAGKGTAEFGALFCTFNINGQPDRASCYFKDIAGRTIDSFTVISRVNLPTSTDPVIDVTPNSQNFGDVPLGSFADRNFTVQNIGGGTLTGNASTNAPFGIVSGGSYNLGANQSQTVVIRFAPTSAGTSMGNVTFTGSGGASRTVTGVGVDSVLPTVTIAATDPNAAEAGQDPGLFTVSRTGSTAAALTVNYTIGGTASNGVDYQTLSGSLTIQSGQATATITVTPIDDSANEGNEGVTVTLSPSASYTVGSPDLATVTITDNDPATTPTIALSYDGQIRDRVGQGEAVSSDGQMDGTFTVTLQPGSGNRTVTRLDLNRSNQSGVWDTQPNNGYWLLGAANGLDGALNNAANGSVNFPLTAGSSFKIFASDYQGELFVSGSSFSLTVSFADGSTATATANVSISALPVVSVVAADATATEAGLATGSFTVSRTGSTASALTVSYTIGGTASNGVDYQMLSGSLTIAAGLSSAAITVMPVDDVAAEGDETVLVQLQANAAYTLGSPNSATVTIIDNDAASTPTIELSYDGQIRDRVGQGEFALSGDGQMDGTFTVTLQPGSGNRTVTRLDLNRSNQSGVWDTQPNNGYWVLGAANSLDGALNNAGNDTVNFPVTAGSSFKIFASDYQGELFVSGSSFTLTVSFADGSTAAANVSISTLPM
jgi:hypothetical protein